MGSAGSAPNVSRGETWCVVSGLDNRHTPLTTTEVTQELESTERVVRDHLSPLADFGELQTRKRVDRSRGWWRSAGGDDQPGRRSVPEEFGAFVSAVEDYAIFELDPNGVVASRNRGAERIKGDSEDEVVGERIVERHDGDIRVNSEVGEGSTFTFAVPAEDRHD